MYSNASSVSVIVVASLLSSALLASDPTPAIQPYAYPNLPAVIIPLGSEFISITRMKVTTQRRDGEWTADVTSRVTLNHVPNVSYTYEAALVDADGKVHTNIRSQPYIASREVSTGDRRDTDKYTVTISLAGLFSSRPPSELFIRARVLDASGNVVATSILQSFTPPKD